VSPYRTCIDCPAPVKLGHRDRCHVCHRRAERAAKKRSCTNCLQLRHLGPGDVCASCVRAAAPPKAPKTIRCISCDQQRRNVGHGLCNRCNLADLDRPFNYAAAQARKMSPVPEWWNEFSAFVAARHHPGGAVAVLRATGRLLAADPTASPHRLLTCSAGAGPTNRALTAFFISRGLALSGDREQRVAAQRRARYLDAVPAALRRLPCQSVWAVRVVAMMDPFERGGNEPGRPARGSADESVRVGARRSSTYVADNFLGWANIVITGTMRDSQFLLYRILNNPTTLDPKEIMPDTASASDLVFGLCQLLGFRYSPRLADLPARKRRAIRPKGRRCETPVPVLTRTNEAPTRVP